MGWRGEGGYLSQPPGFWRRSRRLRRRREPAKTGHVRPLRRPSNRRNGRPGKKRNHGCRRHERQLQRRDSGLARGRWLKRARALGGRLVKIEIDTSSRTLVCDEDGSRRELALYSSEAFAVLSRLWVKVGWDLKYSYGFTWMGRPVIQLPEDVLRIQETIYRVRPDVIIETGVAHGGSLILYASLCAAMQRGRVVGIDIRIRPENRKAIEAHELGERITLLEGSS